MSDALTQVRKHPDAALKTGVTYEIRTDRDIGTVRSFVRALAARLGFLAAGQISIVTAVSELGHNILDKGTGGEVVLSIVLNKAGRQGIQAVARDRGPGVVDEPAADEPMAGPAQRLPTARRIVDEFEIVGSRGEGTAVTIRMWPS